MLSVIMMQRSPKMLLYLLKCFCVLVRNVQFVFWTPFLYVPLSATCQRVCGVSVSGSDCMIVWPEIPAHFVNAVTWFGLRVKNESNFDPVSLHMCILTGFDALVSRPNVTMTTSNSVPSGIVSSDIRIIYYLPILSPSASPHSLVAFNLSSSPRGRIESLKSWRCDSLGEHAWSLLPNDAFMRLLLYTGLTATPNLISNTTLPP